MINGKCSDSVDISIGSRMFYHNDVGDHVRKCRFHLFADDLQIYTVDECRDVNWLVAAGVRPQVVLNRQAGRRFFEGFAFRCVREDEVFAAIMSKGSGPWERMGFRLSL
jgi:hypothetical protein